MEIWQLYLFTIIDDVKSGMVTIFTLCIVILLLGVIFYIFLDSMFNADLFETESKKFHQIVKNLKPFIVICIIAAIISSLNIFIPTQKELAFIYITNKVTTNEELIKIPDKVLEIVNLKLEDIKNNLEEEEDDQETN